MYFKKMKTDVPLSQIVKTCLLRISKALLLPAVLFFLSVLLINPAAAKQNDTLPPAAMAAVAKTMSKDLLPASYDISKHGAGYAAENRAHGMKMTLSDEVIRFCKSDNTWSYAFTLTGIGYDVLKPPSPAEVAARHNRIELRRGTGLTEWYLNTPLGIKQGFTLNHRPDNPCKNAWLRLELTLQGSIDAVLQDNRTLAIQKQFGCHGYTLCRPLCHGRR